MFVRRGRPRLVSWWRRASKEAMRREDAKTCFGGTETNTALLRKAASNSYVLKIHYGTAQVRKKKKEPLVYYQKLFIKTAATYSPTCAVPSA